MAFIKKYGSYWLNIPCAYNRVICAYMGKIWRFYDKACVQEDCPQMTMPMPTLHNNIWRTIHDCMCSLAFMPYEATKYQRSNDHTNNSNIWCHLKIRYVVCRPQNKHKVGWYSKVPMQFSQLHCISGAMENHTLLNADNGWFRETTDCLNLSLCNGHILVLTCCQKYSHCFRYCNGKY